MKVLIVGSPRSGSTYLLNLLSLYYLLDTKTMRDSSEFWDQLSITDEPINGKSNSSQKKIFDQLLTMDSWVVKIHVGHTNSTNYKWMTHLYKQADIIVKLTRNDFFAHVSSLCIAIAMDDFGESHKKDVYISKKVFTNAYWECYICNMKLDAIPCNSVIDYSDLELKSPQDIFHTVSGIHAVEGDFNYLLPKKNTATIKNIEEVNAWMDELSNLPGGPNFYNEYT